MRRRNRTVVAADAREANRAMLATVGPELRGSRLRRRSSLIDVASRTGLSASSVGKIERGLGGSFSLDTLQLVAHAVGRRLDVRLSADPLREPADAGHLAMQELALRLGRLAGYDRTFELATKPADPWRSGDVGLRDDRRRLLMVVECWNTIGDIGAAVRSSQRKRAEAEALAIATAPLDVGGVAVRYRVRLCWIVRSTARNRALVARYPEIFAARLPGSSVGWVRALTVGTEPPTDPGLAWCDLRATRVFAWRKRA